MKKVYLLGFAILLAAACKKQNNTAPVTPTVTRTSTSTGTITNPTVYGDGFSAQDSTIAYGLMTSNNLSTTGFVFYQYQAYNALDQDNQMAYFQLATAKQVRN